MRAFTAVIRDLESLPMPWSQPVVLTRLDQRSLKLSTDPYFVEKVRDIVGLYLSPPTNALVLCVDEKSQCLALERTQPVLPLNFAGRMLGVGFGRPHRAVARHKEPSAR